MVGMQCIICIENNIQFDVMTSNNSMFSIKKNNNHVSFFSDIIFRCTRLNLESTLNTQNMRIYGEHK